jgi:guanylate kinase
VEGENYFFVSDDQFVQMIDEGKFLEHANVFGKRYGTSKAEVAAKRALGQDVILEIDWQGAQQVREAIPDAISVFVLPPSVEELAARLTSRGEDTAQSIEKRLGEAKLDMSQAIHFDYLVINADFETALQDVASIVHAARLTRVVQLQKNEVKELVGADI